jgi:hypothetical protein
MKLTKEQKESIIEKCTAATFGKREAAHEAARTKLADALYAHEHGAAEKIAAKLPKEWQHTIGDFYIKHDGFSNHWRAEPNIASGNLKLSKLHLGPSNHSLYITVKKDHPLYQRADEVARAEVALSKEREALNAKLRRLMASVNTDKQLMEVWPEGKKFFPKFELPARGMIPVSLVGEINSIVGVTA